MHYRTKQELPGGIHDSELPSFSRSLLLWLEVSAKEAMIRNLSLTPEAITESAAKAIAVQQKSLEGFPGGAMVESLPAGAGDTGSGPGLGGSRVPRSN